MKVDQECAEDERLNCLEQPLSWSLNGSENVNVAFSPLFEALL